MTLKINSWSVLLKEEGMFSWYIILSTDRKFCSDTLEHVRANKKKYYDINH